MDRLEEHIKNKLQNREITPSSNAWRKISQELKNNEVSSRKRKINWWAIAAGIMGFILLSVGFFSTKDNFETPNETIVVQQERNKKETLRDVEHDDIDVLIERPKVEWDQEMIAEQEKNKESSIVENNDIKLTETSISKEEVILKDTKEVTDLVIANKVEEVWAKVNSMQNNSITVSDEEIDSLLMAAQREILAQKAFEENGRIDAMALLNEVEQELYNDQQNPLFLKLKEGFFKLRTAVADRNN
ncbi:MAG: hypothetical protein ACFB0A_03380 [Croceivirga sp.]